MPMMATTSAGRRGCFRRGRQVLVLALVLGLFCRGATEAPPATKEGLAAVIQTCSADANMAACAAPFADTTEMFLNTFRQKPTKETRLMLKLACGDRTCNVAGREALSTAFESATGCEDTRYSRLPAIFAAAIDFACLSRFEADGLEHHCITEVGLLLHDHKLVDGLIGADEGFAFPTYGYRAVTLCSALRLTGCCAYTFQRVASAFLLATCHVEKAQEMARMRTRCLAVGIDIGYRVCPGIMPANTTEEAWLSDLSPNRVDIAAELRRCHALPLDPPGYSYSGACWRNECEFLSFILDIYRGLGLVANDWKQYLISIVLFGTGIASMFVIGCIATWFQHVKAMKKKRMLRLKRSMNEAASQKLADFATAAA